MLRLTVAAGPAQDGAHRKPSRAAAAGLAAAHTHQRLAASAAANVSAGRGSLSRGGSITSIGETSAMPGTAPTDKGQKSFLTGRMAVSGRRWPRRARGVPGSARRWPPIASDGLTAGSLALRWPDASPALLPRPLRPFYPTAHAASPRLPRRR